jgi:hypothetical protein
MCYQGLWCARLLEWRVDSDMLAEYSRSTSCGRVFEKNVEVMIISNSCIAKLR